MNNITKAGFKSSNKFFKGNVEALTPYIVDPNGNGTYLTISEAIDAVVADGVNTDPELPTLVLLSSDTHQIGSQLTLPPNIRIAGPGDYGFGYQQATRRAAIVEGTWLIDLDTDTGANYYFLSDVKCVTDSNESVITVDGSNGNPIVNLDGCTLDYNGGGAGTCFDVTSTALSAFYFYECNVIGNNARPSIVTTASGQSVLLRGSYVQGNDLAIECGGAFSSQNCRINGRIKVGSSGGTDHEFKYTEIISQIGGNLIECTSTVQSIISHCQLQHPTAVFECSNASPSTVLESQNSYIDSKTYTNADITYTGRSLDGFIDYNNTTAGSTFSAGVWTTLPNNGLGSFTNDTYAPVGIEDLMDTTTGAIDPTELDLGDVLFVRNDFTINPSVNGCFVSFRYVLGTGGSQYTIEKQLGSLPNGAGLDYKQQFTDLIYMGDANTRDNLIALQVLCSEDCLVTNLGSVITLQKGKAS